MDIWVSGRSYNSYGGTPIFSFVGDLLFVQLDEYGSAVDSLEAVACFRSRSEKPRPTLERMFDQFHDYIKTLPQITFRRKAKRIEIIFLSMHFAAEDNKGCKPSAKQCSLAAEEVAEALMLLRKRIKATDDFDGERFLADARRCLSQKIDSMEEWEDLRNAAKEKRRAIQAMKSPWELLEIDWSQYHPAAKDLLDDPFFWECADDFAPHGNDTGADLLADYRRWDRRNRSRSPLEFLDQLLKGWEIEPIDWMVADEAPVRELQKNKPIELSVCNEAAIALAFAVVKMRAECPSNIKAMAVAALRRSAISAELSDEAIEKLSSKLEALPDSAATRA